MIDKKGIYMKNFNIILSLIITTSLNSMETNKLITDKTLEHYKVFTDLAPSVAQMLRSCDFGRIPLTDGIPWMLTHLQNRYIKRDTLAKLLLCPKILEALKASSTVIFCLIKSFV